MMATLSTIRYRPEKTNRLETQVSRQSAAQNAFTPRPDLRTTLQDLTDVARDLPAEQALCLEIGELCAATLTIDKAFCDIARNLSEASNEQQVDLYDTCCALKTQWNEHHTTYKNLLWDSRKLAGKAQAVVDEFRELVLPLLRNPDTNRSEKQEIIQNQIKVLQDTSQPSQKLSQEFHDFGVALDTYIDMFSRDVKRLVGDQTTKIQELEDRLCSAKCAMEVASQEVKKLAWKFTMDVAVAGVAILLAFLVPALWRKLRIDDAANSGHQLLDGWRQRDVAITEYKEIRTKYNLERVCLSQMMQLETALQDSAPLVHEVTAKLNLFASVWATITADIRQLEYSLPQAEDSTSQLFTRRVERLEKLYGYLSQALRHYQVTVKPPQ